MFIAVSLASPAKRVVEQEPAAPGTTSRTACREIQQFTAAPNTDCTCMAAVAVSVKAPHRMSPPSWSVSPAAALNCRLPPNSARRDCSSTEICRTIESAVTSEMCCGALPANEVVLPVIRR